MPTLTRKPPKKGIDPAFRYLRNVHKSRLSSREWVDLLRLLPGYDPFCQAGECWFDCELAQEVLDFFPECLRHVEGALAGQPFKLERWQQAFNANLFGWQKLDEAGRQVRRYREAMLYVARKNGKTPLVAGIAAYVFFCDDEAGQQDYIAAGEREQAGMLFRHVRGMVEREPELQERCSIYGGNAAAGQSKSLVRESDGSFLRVISADAKGKHGGNTHLAIIDELHVQPDRELVDVLQTSTASENRKQPLIVYLTTADYARESICNEKHEYACKVRDGIIIDAAFLPAIYQCDTECDWTDEGEWAKANPNLGISVNLEFLRRECNKAQEDAAYENTFKRLHLNIKTEQAMRVIQMNRWDACKRQPDLESLKGRVCFGGLDIGATSDFTAFELMFPHDDGQPIEVPVNMEEPDGAKLTILRRSFTLLSWFWLPQHPVKRDPRMQDQIDAWGRQGLIKRTFGEVVDYDVVLADIENILAPYTLGGIAVDRGFQGASMCTNMMKKFGEAKVVQFSQGIISMNQPFREFRELITLGRLHHDGNPVLRWMASNTAAEERGGLCKPSKDMSSEKVDGIVAATMALGLALTVTPITSVYESRGIVQV